MSGTKQTPRADEKLSQSYGVPGGVHYANGFEAQGYAALEHRIANSYQKNVQTRNYRFRTTGNARRLSNVITFNWEMIDSRTSEVAATGLEFLVLDEQRRILADYQFFSR